MSQHKYSWNTIPRKLWKLFLYELDFKTKLHYMSEAISEAKKSDMFPTVGAIVVNNGEIVGRGKRIVNYSNNESGIVEIIHAEHAALIDAGDLSQGADLYSTLEPCFERGNAPYLKKIEPCSILIPEYGIKRVIIGLVDRDKRTSGEGIKKLVKSNVNVEFVYAGLEKELYRLVGNGRFGF